MKKLLFAVLCFLQLNIYAQEKKVIINDIIEKREVADFKGIKVSDGIDMMLSQGAEESVAASATDKKYLALLKTEVKDGTLLIYYDKKEIFWNDNSKRKLKVYVSYKQLNKLQAGSGSTVTTANTINVAQLYMDFTSGASFKGVVDVVELQANQNSGAVIEITGKCSSLKVDVSSGAIFKGFEMVADVCDAKATSGGGVRIKVNKELNAKANSGGGIRYKGDTVIKNIDINSGGMVKKV
jgi:Putative auto-transporter adhesin, head GIN domain